ncbi:MAG TPA: calcium-binding protein, partial [Burkholderiales bacterium]|nr:calcium-binding protein [Burkholderiales bacterium]
MISENTAQTALQGSDGARSHGVPAGHDLVQEYDDPQTGFHAIVSRDPETGEYVVAFTGTQLSGTDALADLHLGTTQWDSAEAHRLLQDLQGAVRDGDVSSVLFTGHSLGGALAEYAAYDFREANQGTPIELVTFDGLGGVEGLSQRRDQPFDPSRLAGIDSAHFADNRDVVTLMSEHVTDETYLLDFGSPNALAAHSLDNFLRDSNLVLTGQPVTPLDYMHIDDAQEMAAFFSNLVFGNPNPNSEAEAAVRAAAGLLYALNHAPADQVAQLADAFFPGQLSMVDWVAAIDFARATPLGALTDVYAMEAAFLGAAAHGLEAARSAGQELTIEAIEGIERGYESLVDIASAGIEATADAADTVRQDATKAYLDTVEVASNGIEAMVNQYDSAVDFTADRIGDLKRFYNDTVNWVADESEKVADLFGATQTEASEIGNRITAEGQRAAASGLDVLKDFLGDSLKGLEKAFGGDDSSGGFPILGGTLDLLRQAKLGFQGAMHALPSSPIILDLDGNGVDASSIADGTYFDFSNTGFAQATGWVSPSDGLLVRDRNGNGTIDNGAELFGNETLLTDGTKAANGFQALAELDSNGNGVIDANDANFGDLKIWEDLNGDGVSSPDELFSFSDAGVRSIDIAYTESSSVDPNGNQHREIGTFTRSDGSIGAAEDVWFKTDTLNTIQDQVLPITTAIATLPDIKGAGTVYDLHQAMVRDASGQLEGLVQSFANETDIQSRNATLQELLFRWTGVDAIDPDSRGWFDAQKLGVMEKFFGEQFIGYDGSSIVNSLNALGPLIGSYEHLFELTYAQLMAETHLKGIYDSITYSWDSTTHSLRGDLTAVYARLGGEYATDPAKAIEDVSEFQRTIRGLQTTSLLTTPSEIHGSIGDEVIFGVGNPVQKIFAGFGNDVIEVGRDTLYPAWFDINLYSGTLVSGLGNDTLMGGAESDTYVFNRGDGQDTIQDNSIGTYQGWAYNVLQTFQAELGQSDALQFGAGISASDLGVRLSGNDLVLTINNPVNPAAADRITIQNWALGSVNWIENLQFADGTTLSSADLNQMIETGTEGNDVLAGFLGLGLTYQGLGGDDTVSAQSGNDTIYGGDGNDTITDSGGSNSIDGGVGDDTISVHSGNNTILGGDGNDAITVIGAGNNTILGEDGNDAITVIGEGNDVLTGGAGNDVIRTDQTVFSSYGSVTSYTTTLTGGTGNDTLIGGAESDTYVFNRGDGQDAIQDNSIEYYQSWAMGVLLTYADSYFNMPDTLRFGAGIGASDLGVQLSGNDLVLTIDDPANPAAADQITIQNWALGSVNWIENLQFADGTNLSVTDINTLLQTGTEGNDVLTGFANVGMNYRGLGGDDAVSAQSGNDTIYGGEGNDTITDSGGSNYVDGGAGDDTIRMSGDLASQTIYGGAGNDTVVLGGDGNSATIYGGAGADSIAVRGGTRGMIDAGDGDDTITIGGVASPGVIDDGGSTLVLQGGAGNDLIQVDPQAVYQIIWEAQTDLITLEGGAGNDTLLGGAESDTYVFNRGDGQDTIQDNSVGNYQSWSWGVLNQVTDDLGAPDTLRFGAGISASDIGVRLSGNDLVLTINDPANPAAADQITIQNWALGATHWIEHFQFADGTTLGISDINAMIQTGTEGNDVLTGFANAGMTYRGLGGDDTISAQLGNDTIYGGEGNDTITDSGGSNYVDGGAGADAIRVSGDWASQTIYGGEGNDTVVLDGDGNSAAIYGGAGADSISVRGGTSGTVDAGDGDDTITVGGAANTGMYDVGGSTLVLQGGAGNDLIQADPQMLFQTNWLQNDVITLVGGVGNDTLLGGAESDTYVFNRGDGQDTIQDNSVGNYLAWWWGGSYQATGDLGASDTLRFGAGIGASDIGVQLSGNDLVLTINDPANPAAADQITIQNWALGTTHWIEHFQFADGTTLGISDINAMIQTGTEGNDVLTGFANAGMTYRGLGGDDTIVAQSGNDTIYGGEGNDTITDSGGSNY